MGKVSYGLYVLHAWVWIAVGAALALTPLSREIAKPLQYLVAIPLLFGLAIVSYRYFEKPFLRLKARYEFVESRPV